jgi:hypothetical protein
MNWRRGLTRTWLVGTVVWLALWAWYAEYPCWKFGRYLPGDTFACQALATPLMPAGTEWLLVWLGVPIAIGIVGAAAYWAAIGYASKSN